MTLWTEMRPSWKAYRAAPGKYASPTLGEHYIREEFSISTRGVIVWLLTWCNCRHSIRDRYQARGMLESLLGKTLCGHGFLHTDVSQAAGASFGLCNIGFEGNDNPCAHIRVIFTQLAADHGHWSPAALVTVVTDLLLVQGCGAASYAAELLICRVSRAVDAYMENVEGCDSMRPYTADRGKR